MGRTTPCNVRMDKITRERFEKMSKDQGMTLAQTMRQMINDRWSTTVENEPRCASGAPCCMPAVFVNNHSADILNRLKEAAAPADGQPDEELFERKDPPPIPWNPEPEVAASRR